MRDARDLTQEIPQKKIVTKLQMKTIKSAIMNLFPLVQINQRKYSAKEDVLVKVARRVLNHAHQ